jgi:imidazolonepropionase-like amidohydrolase
MRNLSLGVCALTAAAVIGLGAQSRPAATVPADGPVLYENARLIPGDGGAAIERAAMLAEQGVITRVGAAGRIAAPASVRRVDLTGKTVMPALIATHVHPGFQQGLSYSAANYTRETVVSDLARALYFGVSVVQSQGIETGDLFYQLRAEQANGRPPGALLQVAGRGIGSPNAGPGGAAYAGLAYEVTTEAEARQAVADLAARQVDMVKIWVDDRNGRAPKLSPPLYRAVIDEAHRRQLRVIAHVFYHTDAVDLVDAGIDAFAHLVRDTVMDDALVAAIVKKHVVVMGNLTTPLKPTYASLPPWLTAGDAMHTLLAAALTAPVVERMTAYYAKRDPKSVAGARQRYGILQRSLAKLNAAGATIVLGADTGLEDHPFGFAEQLELQAMVEAGMTPAQAIVAATGRAAAFLNLRDTGVLSAGQRADFLVLDANPLTDITNTRRISRVVIGNREVDRQALLAVMR